MFWNVISSYLIDCLYVTTMSNGTFVFVYENKIVFTAYQVGKDRAGIIFWISALVIIERFDLSLI